VGLPGRAASRFAPLVMPAFARTKPASRATLFAQPIAVAADRNHVAVVQQSTEDRRRGPVARVRPGDLGFCRHDPILSQEPFGLWCPPHNDGPRGDDALMREMLMS
jgi:hypothetical protein